MTHVTVNLVSNQFMKELNIHEVIKSHFLGEKIHQATFEVLMCF